MSLRISEHQVKALEYLRDDPDATPHELVEAADLPLRANIAQAFLWRMIDQGLVKLEITLAGRKALAEGPTT